MSEVYRIEYKDYTTKGKWDLERYILIINDKHKFWIETYLKSRCNGIEFRLLKEDRFTLEDFLVGVVARS